MSAAVQDALQRLIAFELQLGPFAVAQLRLLAEVVDLVGAPPRTSPRMFVTDTLSDPEDLEGWMPALYGEIARFRREANRIKREQPITVVMGNPPYKEKAKGLGGWVEGKDGKAEAASPLAEWMPPAGWNAGAHSKHLRNLYVYFWRWATWKVFDHHPDSSAGIVCFITVAGFLNGPGFQRMRWYLRRKCDEIYVVDCSPEGHQPEANTRIFQDVQQPICIVLASRSPKSDEHVPATVRFRALPAGRRDEKFKALQAIRLGGEGWIDCPQPQAAPGDDAGSDPDWRAPFLPASTGAWATYPRLEDFFIYNGSGVMPGRTWIIAPDAISLERRWLKLVNAPEEEKETLFHPHLRNGEPGDKHVHKFVKEGLQGFPARLKPVADEAGPCIDPVLYGFRSFDRQWIIPDSRLINQPNPTLWEMRSERQIFLTAVARTSPSAGPALTFTGLVPDLDHYNGRGGRTLPLWSDAGASNPNIRPRMLVLLSERLKRDVAADVLFAYTAAVAAHPGFTTRFKEDLATPGLRIPLTSDRAIFEDAVDLGRRVVWLHTFGERMADSAAGRPPGPPRLPPERAPSIPKEGAIPQDEAGMPDSLDYDPAHRRLLVGRGFIENVTPEVWRYEVSGKQVLLQWFSYRRKNRDRPIIGDRRPPSPLGDIQPEAWQVEYTSELLNVLHVLTFLVDLEPKQAALLERICAGSTLTNDELVAAGAFELPAKVSRADIKKSLGKRSRLPRKG